MFLWIYIPYGKNGCIDVFLWICILYGKMFYYKTFLWMFIPCRQKNLGAFLRRRCLTIEKDSRQVTIPRRGFTLMDDDCKTAQFLINPLTGNGCIGQMFLWLYIPYGKTFYYKTFLWMFIPCWQKNLGAFLRRRIITIEKDSRQVTIPRRE